MDLLKVQEDLLSSSHPIGRFKAAFFRSLGYEPQAADRLIADLRALGIAEEAIPGQPSGYGTKYEVRGILTGPSGRQAHVVTVWIILTGEDAPRLITVYPGRAS